MSEQRLPLLLELVARDPARLLVGLRRAQQALEQQLGVRRRTDELDRVDDYDEELLAFDLDSMPTAALAIIGLGQ